MQLGVQVEANLENILTEYQCSGRKNLDGRLVYTVVII